MLNLLPPSEKRILLQEKQKRLFIVLFFELSIFLFCVVLVLLAIEFYALGELTLQNFLLQKSGEESRSSEFIYFKEAMEGYNQKLISMNSFYKNQEFMSDALDTLLSVERPDGLYFKRLSFQPEDHLKVIITGFSKTRDGLINFKSNIESEKSIKNVNFSSESWISPKDVNFNLTLDIIDE